MGWTRVLAIAWLVLIAASKAYGAEPQSSGETVATEPANKAWWTGPLLTWPADTIGGGSFDLGTFLNFVPLAGIKANAHSKAVPNQSTYNITPFAIYGVTDRLNVGVFPVIALNQVTDAGTTTQMGDSMVEGEYRLNQFNEGNWIPTTSVSLAESFPTGRYSGLNNMRGGLGAGTYTTTLSLYTKRWFNMPTGRLLRASLDLSLLIPSQANLKGISVYGTEAGFVGHVTKAPSWSGNVALEYSLTQRLVGVVEFLFHRYGDVSVVGRNALGDIIQTASGNGYAAYVAPSFEYSWNGATGIAFGARIHAAGDTGEARVTPMILLNHYFTSDAS